MVSVLNSGASGPGSSPGRGQCVVTITKPSIFSCASNFWHQFIIQTLYGMCCSRKYLYSLHGKYVWFEFPLPNVFGNSSLSLYFPLKLLLGFPEGGGGGIKRFFQEAK